MPPVRTQTLQQIAVLESSLEMSRQENDMSRAKQQELASSLAEKELQITSLEGRLNDSELQLTIKTEVGCSVCICSGYTV
jgi:hypothetical protein